MAYETHANGSWFDETNLVAYYKLEDVNDSSVNGYTLTNINTVTFVAGKFTNCALLVEASSKALHQTNATIGYTAPFTASFWYNPVSLPSTGEYHMLLQFQAAQATGVRFGMFLTNASGSQVQMNLERLKSAPTTSITSLANITLSTGTWYHLVFLYDASYYCRCYLNGILHSSTASGSNAVGDGTWDSHGPAVNIGAAWDGGASYNSFLDGKIDEMIIETRAWTAAEIAKYYENSKGQFLGQVAF